MPGKQPTLPAKGTKAKKASDAAAELPKFIEMEDGECTMERLSRDFSSSMQPNPAVSDVLEVFSLTAIVAP